MYERQLTSFIAWAHFRFFLSMKKKREKEIKLINNAKDID